MDNLTKLLADQKDIIDGVDSWTSSFVSYVQLATGSTGFPKFNDTFFNSILIQVGFLGRMADVAASISRCLGFDSSSLRFFFL